MELLLHRVHCALDHGVRVVKEGEGGVNQLRPGAGHSLLKFDFNFIKKPNLTRKRIFHPPTQQSQVKDPFCGHIMDLINIRQQSDKGLHHESEKNEDCVLK